MKTRSLRLPGEGPRTPPKKYKITSVNPPAHPMVVLSEHTATAGTPMQLGLGDFVSDVLGYWTAQVLSPDDIFRDWDTTPSIRIEFGDVSLLSSFTQFIVTNFPEGEKKPIMCQGAEFFHLCRTFIRGFKKGVSHVTIPSRTEVTNCLQRFGNKVHLATLPLQASFAQVHDAYADDAFHGLHLLITPSLNRGSSARDSLISYYNITQTGQVASDSHQVSTRLCDMPTIHPMFGDAGWAQLLYSIAGLACLHNLYIYFRFDAARHHQYVFVHEQAFHVQKMGEDSLQGRNVVSDRYSMTLCTTTEESDNGNTPQWICDVNAPDVEGVEGEPLISSKLPAYRGLRVRFMFRDDYSNWFF